MLALIGKVDGIEDLRQVVNRDFSALEVEKNGSESGNGEVKEGGGELLGRVLEWIWKDLEGIEEN